MRARGGAARRRGPVAECSARSSRAPGLGTWRWDRRRARRFGSIRAISSSTAGPRAAAAQRSDAAARGWTRELGQRVEQRRANRRAGVVQLTRARAADPLGSSSTVPRGAGERSTPHTARCRRAPARRGARRGEYGTAPSARAGTDAGVSSRSLIRRGRLDEQLARAARAGRRRLRVGWWRWRTGRRVDSASTGARDRVGSRSSEFSSTSTARWRAAAERELPSSRRISARRGAGRARRARRLGLVELSDHAVVAERGVDPPRGLERLGALRLERHASGRPQRAIERRPRVASSAASRCRAARAPARRRGRFFGSASARRSARRALTRGHRTPRRCRRRIGARPARCRLGIRGVHLEAARSESDRGLECGRSGAASSRRVVHRGASS